MMRSEGTTGRRIGGPAHLPIWTGMLPMVKHRFDQEITALREDAWRAYALRVCLDDSTPESQAFMAEAKEAFMAGFNQGSAEAAARILRILEYEEGITEPMHHDAVSGVSTTTVRMICDEFGLEQRKGRHA